MEQYKLLANPVYTFGTVPVSKVEIDKVKKDSLLMVNVYNQLTRGISYNIIWEELRHKIK